MCLLLEGRVGDSGIVSCVREVRRSRSFSRLLLSSTSCTSFMLVLVGCHEMTSRRRPVI